MIVVALMFAAALFAGLVREDAEQRRTRPKARERSSTEAVSSRVDLVPTRPSPTTTDAAAVPPSRGAKPAHGPASRPATGVDPPPRLRGVRGVVRDARTGAPIPEAWVTWRLPGPAVLDDTIEQVEFFRYSDTGMVTDALGRFEVQRLPDDQPVAHTLFASARGYGSAALRPGLREEVVFDLEPMATLVVRVSGWDPEAGRGWQCPFHLERAGLRVTPEHEWQETEGERKVWRIPLLAPGRWRVQVAGRTAAEVSLAPGQVVAVDVAVPPLVVVEGVVVGAEPDDELAVTRLDLLGENPRSTRLDRGAFALEVPAGTYVFTLLARKEIAASLAVLDVQPGLPRLTLRVPVTHAVDVDLGAPRKDVALLALDDERGLGLSVLASDAARPGHHFTRAATGRYAVVQEDGPFLGVIDVPADRALRLETTPFRVTLRFDAPGLREGEVIRGKLWLLPQVLVERPTLRRLYEQETTQIALRVSRDGPTVGVDLVAAGPYHLVGETDLGPLEVPLDLAPGLGEVVVPLE